MCIEMEIIMDNKLDIAAKIAEELEIKKWQADKQRERETDRQRQT